MQRVQIFILAKGLKIEIWYYQVIEIVWCKVCQSCVLPSTCMIRKFVIEGHIKSGQQLAFWTLLISTFIGKKAAFSCVN